MSQSVELPLAGREVARVDVSRYVPFLRLEFWGSEDSTGAPGYSLVIEGPFRLESPTRAIDIDPSKGPDPAYMRLVRKTVRVATANADGGLRVEFMDGDVLSVRPDRLEPWQLEPLDDQGFRVVSVAGGGLAVWPPECEASN